MDSVLLVMRSKFRIIILGDNADLQRLCRDHIMEADGILASGLSAEALISSLRLIQTAERVFPTDLMPSLRQGVSEPRSFSPREEETLRHVAQGESNKTIARKLGITEATAKFYVKTILRKLRVQNRTQAAIWAQNNGFGDPQEAK